MLSCQTLRQKIANYLQEELSRQKTNHLIIHSSRSELAELPGMPRPSLSRELAAMQKDGLLAYDRKTIKILDQAGLETLFLFFQIFTQRPTAGRETGEWAFK